MPVAFLSSFKANHPPNAVSAVLKLRLRLLQYVSLFTRRLRMTWSSPDSESLQHLRSVHKARARRRKTLLSLDFNERSSTWDALPLSGQQLAAHRQYVLHTLKIKGTEAERYISPSSVTMLDLLPKFMALSAYLYQEAGWEVKERWLELAAEFMMQAALEQYLVYSAGDAQVLRECFSYGWDPSFKKDRIMAKYSRDSPGLGDQVYREMGDDEETINEIFHDEETETEIGGWKEIRERFLGFFKPEKDVGIVRQLELTAAQHPILKFEGQVMYFLGALQKAQETPILIQLEEGKLEDMSVEETTKLKERIGWQL